MIPIFISDRIKAKNCQNSNLRNSENNKNDSEDITFVIFTVYLIEKSLYFIGKHIYKKMFQTI